MMGYAELQQVTSGIHQRLRSRVFIIVQQDKRIVLITSDLCFITQSVKQVFVEEVQKIFGHELYTEENIMMSATHTHSGPGGYAYHPLYDISTLGFNKQNFDAIINGTLKAFLQAHRNLAAGILKLNRGQIVDSSINRSPSAYSANPLFERMQYDYDTDKEATLFRFVQTESNKTKDIGMIGWFAVHGTSMNNSNYFITGDNKGYASYLMEKEMNHGSLPGAGPFVAAFAQSNEGDSTPNIKGAFCQNMEPCETVHSTCDGWSQGCRGYGPSPDQFESCRLIGNSQYKQMRTFFHYANQPIQGDIQYMHIWVDMENLTITPQYSDTGSFSHTCIGALGDSFASGTTDGPGQLDFVQGTNDSSTNAYWNWLTSKLLAEPTAYDIECHYPKPILFISGSIKFPSKWTQGIVPLQVFKIGDIWIISAPAEFSTMAGRRLRNKIKFSIQNAGLWNQNSHIVIAGLSNSYTHYVTTREEYSYQRYEGASTLFGPSTLNAYEMLYSDLVDRISRGLHAPPSQTPELISPPIFNFQPPLDFDSVPEGAYFGQVIIEPYHTYQKGQIVHVGFWSANPRNNLRHDSTFLNILFKNNTNTWLVIADDGDWETKYTFKQTKVPNQAHAIIEWEIPIESIPGVYRIVHFGDFKSPNETINSFSGTTKSFVVV